MFPEIRLGLPEPETAEETQRQSTIDGMRMAIARGQRDSHLINAALRTAEIRGLSGEDKYVMLAYHALISLEKAHRQVSDLLRLMPVPVLPKLTG